jgi:hypothetical protein
MVRIVVDGGSFDPAGDRLTAANAELSDLGNGDEGLISLIPSWRLPLSVSAHAPACSGLRDIPSARRIAAISLGHFSATPGDAPSSVRINGSAT